MTHVLNRGVAGSVNEKPHVLVPHLDPNWGNGVRWTVECPYTGERPCGVLIECTEHPRWAEPKGVHEPGPEGWPVPAESFRPEWEAWAKADDEWSEEHPQGPWHPSDQCWYAHVLVEGDYEPEYYLNNLTPGPITGPIETAVASDGYEEEQEPLFYPWKEETP